MSRKSHRTVSRRIFLGLMIAGGAYIIADAAVKGPLSALLKEAMVGKQVITETTSSTAVIDKTPLAIRDFEWQPTRVLNSKVYDAVLSFTVEDDESEIASVSASLLEYPSSLPAGSYPEEPPRPLLLTPPIGPSQGKTARFSGQINDLKGGKQYQARITSKDAAENTSERTFETPYVREFESLSLPADLDVSASYMPWDFRRDAGLWKKELPLLGTYDTIDDIVRSKHIDWANGHGINAFFVDGGEWAGSEVHPGRVLRGFLDAGMKAGILWGPWTGNYLRGTLPGAPDWSVDLSHPRNYDTFLNVARGLIASGFFSHSSYYKIKGRPAIFLYDAQPFLNEHKAFEDLRELFRNNVGTEPFIIADLVLRIPDLPYDSESYINSKHFPSYDAITGWAGLVRWPNEDMQYVTWYEHFYDTSLFRWREFARYNGLHFMPTVIAGFDNTYSWGPPDSLPYSRSLNQFEDRLRIALRYVDELKLLRIDTWNNFGEWTYIEPSSKTGFSYLEVLKERLMTAPM